MNDDAGAVAARARTAAVMPAAIPAGAVALLGAYVAFTTRHWGLILDAPVLHYVAAQMHAQAVPYRDIFDNNMPLSQWIHYAILGAAGGSDGAFRAADLVAVAALCVILYRHLAPLSRLAGILVGALVALFHFSSGPEAMGERDFFALLPMAGAAWAYDRAAAPGGYRRAVLFLAGVLLGAAALIKPTFLLALAAFVLHVPLRERALRPALAPMIALVGGAGLAIAAAALVLALQGALIPFLLIQTGFVAEVYGRVRMPFVAGLLSRAAVFVIPIALAWPAVLRGDARLRRTAAIFAMLAVTGALGYLLQGKFFPYHLYPAVTFAIALGGTGLAALLRGGRSARAGAVGIAGLAAVAVFAYFAVKRPALLRSAAWERPHAVSAIVEDLAKLGPAGRVVQPLDVSDGALHAMFLTGARSPTRFIQVYPFFLPDHGGEVAALRQELMDGLRASGYPPIFLYRALSTRLAAWNPAMANAPLTTWWPEFASFLDANYRLLAHRTVDTGTEEGRREYDIFVARDRQP